MDDDDDKDEAEASDSEMVVEDPEEDKKSMLCPSRYRMVEPGSWQIFGSASGLESHFSGIFCIFSYRCPY